MDGRVVSARWAQRVRLSKVDSTFEKVVLRSPSLIFLLPTGRAVILLPLWKNCFSFRILWRSGPFWATLTFKGWYFVTKMCSSHPAQQLWSRAHPSCCAVGFSVALEFHWFHDRLFGVYIRSVFTYGQCCNRHYKVEVLAILSEITVAMPRWFWGWLIQGCSLQAPLVDSFPDMWNPSTQKMYHVVCQISTAAKIYNYYIRINTE